MEVMDKFTDAGVHLDVDGDRLLAGPREALTDDLRQVLRENKEQILDVLKNGPSYTLADIAEMDALLHKLAAIEGWSDTELADKLDQRRRMAPIKVPAALRLLRAGVAKAALDTKKPNKRVPGGCPGIG
jgi:hypothetical protein